MMYRQSTSSATGMMPWYHIYSMSSNAGQMYALSQPIIVPHIAPKMRRRSPVILPDFTSLPELNP